LRRLSAIPFRATFDGDEIFDAMSQMKGGWGEYAGVRTWEVEVMLAMQMTEERYGELSLQQRARLVAGHHLRGWMKSLESDKAAEEAKKQR